MSLEDVLNRHSEALDRNTAAILGKAGEPKKAPGRPKAVTFDEVKAMGEKVMEAKGKDAAVALIKKHGAAKLAELDKSKYAAFIAAGEVLMNEEEETEAEEAGDEI